MPNPLLPFAGATPGASPGGGGPINYMQQFGLGSGMPYGSNPGAYSSTPGNLPGAPGTSGAGPYGTVPQVPDPSQTQLTTILNDLKNLGNLGNLTTDLNSLIAKNAALPYQMNLPNYNAMTGQSSGNILSLLKGQVPQDVANQLAQLGAERGVATGSIGSPNSNTALMRALGLTSLGLQQQGEGDLTAAINRTPTGKQFDPSSFLISPEFGTEMQYLANLLRAAPDPRQAAEANLLNTLGGLGAGLGNRNNQPNTFMPFLGPGQTPSPYSGGQMPLGGINPTSPGTFGGSANLNPETGLPWDWQTGMQTPPGYSGPPLNGFNFNEGLPQGWQTGMPLEGYQGPQWGGGAYPGTGADLGPGIPYTDTGGTPSFESDTGEDLFGGF